MAVEEHFDVIVVGTGFGGSPTALRLAEAGRSVLVLERGQPHPPGSFARTPYAMRTNFWAPEEAGFGLFDLWAFDSLDVVLASGLGGGSLIYANVMLRKEERTFVREDLANGGYENWPVTRADLEPHYDRFERIQKPQPFPLEAGEPYSTTSKTRAMLEAAESMGLPCELPPLAVAFAAAAGERPAPGRPLPGGEWNVHGTPRSTCRLCGECDIGCNYGSKNTLDLTCLSEAWRLGAQLRCCCEVQTIAPATDGGRRGGYVVGYRQHLAARDGHPAHLVDHSDEEQRLASAEQVVLAAGAIGSPRLLLANRASLPRLSPALGTRLSANGDYLALVRNCRVRGEDGKQEWRYLDPSHGPVITASIHVEEERSASGRGYYLQDAGAPAFADWLWQELEIPADLWRARRKIARRLSDRLRGRRDTHQSDVAAALFGDAHTSAAMMPLLAMGRDVPDGRLRLEGDRLELDWSAKPSHDYYDGVRDSLDGLAAALGGDLIKDPLDRRSRAVTVHPVGGCAMATDPRRGVVDAWGRVHGYPGLWIADGSVMPGPVGPNPSFTIAALADRFADAMIEGRQR
jgi:cholesterol oxidase